MAVADMDMAGGTGGSLRPEREPPGRNLLRGLIVALLGAVTSFGLFWVMQRLISTPGKLDEAGKKLAIEFVRLRKDTSPEPKEREKPKKQKPEQQPPPPEMNVAKDINPGDAVGDIVPIIDTSAELAEATSLAAGGADRSAVPLVQVLPEYPERAKSQGLRGWVDVMFTITAVGTVADAKVLKSSLPVAFERAALDAVRRWKYNPKIKNGVAVARPGQVARLNFEPPKGRR